MRNYGKHLCDGKGTEIETFHASWKLSIYLPLEKLFHSSAEKLLHSSAPRALPLWLFAESLYCFCISHTRDRHKEEVRSDNKF